MGKITEQLIRRRSEHNEGVISTLEEISLHQFEIEKIENLDVLCRHLKILFLQNNIIERIENIEKLKELEYLNLAVNNISMIENIDQCESLTKLDLTLNFIDIEDLSASMKNLVNAPKIKELYLTGNPCENWSGCKEYVIASVPQLCILNGAEILKSERIKATQNFSILEKELEEASIENIIKKDNDPDKDNPNKYTKEYRRKMYLEQEEERLKKEEEMKKKDKPWGYYDDSNKEPPSVYKEDGEIRLCNQGKYEFLFDEDIFHTGITTVELKLPKFMDTSQIKVDLNPQYVRIDAKGKITQLKFDHEIIVEKSTIQRSTTTGILVIKAPIVGIKPKETKKESTKKEISHTENKKVPNKNKILKPLDESLDIKNNNIQLVKETESKMIKQPKKEEKIDIDFNIDELPDLD